MLGTPDPYGRQLNGMGGGISSLSKVAIIGPPTHPDADVDYTFGQVVVDRPLVDYGANCGNLSSVVGPFAVDTGLVAAADGEALVRIHNTNTRKIIHARFEVKDGKAVTQGDFAIAGVAGTAARIRLDFLDPGGTVTPGLLPTGNVVDRITVDGVGELEVSLVDASNPVVYVRASDLGLEGTELPDEIEAVPGLMAKLDRIRRQAGVLMGLARDTRGCRIVQPEDRDGRSAETVQDPGRRGVRAGDPRDRRPDALHGTGASGRDADRRHVRRCRLPDRGNSAQPAGVAAGRRMAKSGSAIPPASFPSDRRSGTTAAGSPTAPSSSGLPEP